MYTIIVNYCLRLQRISVLLQVFTCFYIALYASNFCAISYLKTSYKGLGLSFIYWV